MGNYQSIDCEVVDKMFHHALEKKPDRTIIKGQIDMEHIAIQNKVDFIYDIIFSFNVSQKATYRILFWEKDEDIIRFLQRYFPSLEFIIYKSSLLSH